MATALVVVFEVIDPETDAAISVSSQTINFIDHGPALRALEQIEKTYDRTWIKVTGTILKDVIT